MDVPRANLARVVGDLGDTLLEVLAGNLETYAEVGGVVLHDEHRKQHLPTHAVVLGVGVREDERVIGALRTASAHQAVALVVSMPFVVSDEVGQAAADANIALLGLTAGASWLQLADVMRTSLTTEATAEAHETMGGLPSGDLFALANAIAALIDAPITIEDRRFRVLAFSGRQSEADRTRIQTILERQVPESDIRDHEQRGILKRLYASDDPIFIEVPEPMKELEIPRVAMAVRAGDEILGSIWAAVRGPMPSEHLRALRDVAPLVALHLLRRRAGADVDRRLRSDLVATALEGGADAQHAIDRLGLSHRSLTVLAADLLAPVDKDEELTAAIAERQKLVDALTTHLTAMAPRSEVAVLGDVVYGLVPVSGPGDPGTERVRSIAGEFLERMGRRLSVVIGIGAVVDDAAGLPAARLRADRALRVLRSRGVSGVVATGADVFIDDLILDMKDLARTRDEALSGPLARLKEYDQRRRSQLIDTLRHWLDAFGDIPTAAAAARVHPNTFRYRLQRLIEVGGVDLASAEDRFALQLQLRLLDADAG